MLNRIGKGVPLGTIHPAGFGNVLEGIVQFAGGIVFRLGMAHEFDAGIKSHNGIGIASFYGISINLGNILIEVNVHIAAVKPPACHLITVSGRPLINNLRPLFGKSYIKRLILGTFGQPECLLGAFVAIRYLTRQVQYQPDAFLAEF